MTTDHSSSRPGDLANGAGRSAAHEEPADAPKTEAALEPSQGLAIAIDAMGGDLGPEAVVAGVVEAAALCPDARFLLFGDADQIKRAADAAFDDGVAARCDIRHCDGVISMDARPTEALRNGRDSSMGRTLDAVVAGEASAAVSSGNTGALMTMALVRLRAATGVERPAIAALWPSLNAAGFNVVLDVGANVRNEARDLVANAAMGAEYARICLDLEQPKVALLNIGEEESKGLPHIREAADRLADAAEAPGARFDFVGFVEGHQIASDHADVIATDGFTGNIALKTAEGTAQLISAFLRQSLTENWVSRLGAALASDSLGALKRRIDPRRVNGGVLLGLNGVVVKSHGGSDATAFAAAVALAVRLARRDISTRIAAQVAKLASADHSLATETSPNAAAGSV